MSVFRRSRCISRCCRRRSGLASEVTPNSDHTGSSASLVGSVGPRPAVDRQGDEAIGAASLRQGRFRIPVRGGHMAESIVLAFAMLAAETGAFVGAGVGAQVDNTWTETHNTPAILVTA